MNKQLTKKKTSILLAEDDLITLKLVSHWLKQAGYEIRQATNGEEALASIREECPDILITDWQMPRMTGLELCQALRQEELPHYIHILFLTAKVSPRHIQEALAAGADDYVTKPTTQEDLLARIQQAEFALERRQEQMALAEIDPLTGAFNRRTFIGHCTRETARASRHGAPLSCAMLDIDLFKSINDTHGHSFGDRILKAIADVLRSLSRSDDYIYRFGGDEFCILLPNTDESQAAQWGERVRIAVAGIAIDTQQRIVHPSVTIGIAAWHQDLKSPQHLIDLADEALLAAKQAGRNRVQQFSNLNNSSMLNHVDISNNRHRLKTACARDIMTSPITCLKEQELVRDAADLFLRLRINSLPVINGEQKLSGIISEQDLLSITLSNDAWDMPIRDVMKTNVVCYDEETPVMKIWDFLRRVTIRRVVIVRDGMPTGVISRGGLLRWLGNWDYSYQSDDPRYTQLTNVIPRETFHKTIASIQEELAHLEKNIESAENVVPCLVNGATIIQEYTQDLLGLSQVLHQFQPDTSCYW